MVDINKINKKKLKQTNLYLNLLAKIIKKYSFKFFTWTTNKDTNFWVQKEWVNILIQIKFFSKNSVIKIKIVLDSLLNRDCFCG